jgi:hypothetical protein
MIQILHETAICTMDEPSQIHASNRTLLEGTFEVLTKLLIALRSRWTARNVDSAGILNRALPIPKNTLNTSASSR